MAYSQIKRALTLVNLLQSGHNTDVESLARSLGCSARTVFRDIKLLNDNNIQVRFDETLGGYTIDSQVPALASSIGEEELAGLLVAAIFSPLSRQRPAGGISHQALVKMMRRIAETRGRVSRMVAAIVPPPGRVEMDPKECKVFDKLIQAIADRRRATVQWSESGETGGSSTLLSAYQLRVNEGQWTVIGWSSSHGDVAEFRLSAIRSVVSTESPYRVPIRFLRQRATPPPLAEGRAAKLPKSARSDAQHSASAGHMPRAESLSGGRPTRGTRD